MLSNLKSVLAFAERHSIAIGAFTVVTREDIQGTVAAAEELNLPVILQASAYQLEAAGLEELAAEMLFAAERATVPVVVQLDHGRDFAAICKCLRNGFSSVLVDGSLLEYEGNVQLTRKVVEIAHPMGVSVEAELGHIGGTEDDIHSEGCQLTSPQEAATFVRETNVDALAVAIGTAHGAYKREPRLDFQRLTEIRNRVPVPLVLHGGSMLEDEVFVEAVRRGIRKINIGTELKRAHIGSLRKVLAENPEIDDPRHYLHYVRKSVKELVLSKMRVFAATGEKLHTA